jgi:hypothetical protein
MDIDMESPNQPRVLKHYGKAQKYETSNITIPPDAIDVPAMKKVKHTNSNGMKSSSATIIKRKIDSIVVDSKEYKLPISKWSHKAIVITPNTATSNKNMWLKNCEQCTFQSFNKTKFNEHLLLHEKVQQELKTLTHAVYYKCKQCNIYYNKEIDLKIHLKQHQGAKLICNTCLVEFTSYQK